MGKLVFWLARLGYFPLKLYVRLAAFLYFDELRIRGKENIFHHKPVIFAVNHQNALLDALLISVMCRRNPHFLTRADVFQGKLVQNILAGLRMLPAYRIRDGLTAVKRNQETFNSTTQILGQNGAVALFPEGNHAMAYFLRPLKKGVAKIASTAMEHPGLATPVSIIPVGIYYESYTHPRRTLITIGQPIDTSKYQALFHDNPQQATANLLADLSAEMKQLQLNFNDENQYERHYSLFQRYRHFESDLEIQLAKDQLLVDKICLDEPPHFIEQNPGISQKANMPFWRKVYKLINYVPLKIIDYCVEKYTKDPHFYGTNRFIYTIFLMPLGWLGLGLTLWLLFWYL